MQQQHTTIVRNCYDIHLFMYGPCFSHALDTAALQLCVDLSKDSFCWQKKNVGMGCIQSTKSRTTYTQRPQVGHRLKSSALRLCTHIIRHSCMSLLSTCGPRNRDQRRQHWKHSTDMTSSNCTCAHRTETKTKTHPLFSYLHSLYNCWQYLCRH